MSMAERSYFKRYASKLTDHETTNYIQLFDAVAAQTEYDEAALKKKFSKEKFVKQFSVAKNYLTKAILKSLRNFHEESNPAYQSKALVLELSILMDKGIYEHSLKVIKKGAELASRYELYQDKSEFLSKEIYLLMNHAAQNTSRTIQLVLKEQEALNSKIQLLTAFENLYQRQNSVATSSYQIRNESSLKILDEIFNDPLIKNEKYGAEASRISYYHFYIRAIHYSLLDNREFFLREAKRLVAVCNKSEHFSAIDIRSFLNAINLLLEASYFNAEWEEMKKALDQLQQLNVKSERDKIAQFIYYSRFALVYFDQKQNARLKLELMEEAWKTFKKLGNQIPYHVKISLIVTYSSALMEMGKYSNAIDWINLYSQNKKEDQVRYDVQSILLMFQLIAHFELNNILLVKNLIPNISRYIKSVGQLSNFEKVVISFFKKLTSSKTLPPQIFDETLNALNMLKQGDILNRNRATHDIFRNFIIQKKNGKKYHELKNQEN